MNDIKTTQDAEKFGIKIPLSEFSIDRDNVIEVAINSINKLITPPEERE
jgi:hypothetical protein